MTKKTQLQLKDHVLTLMKNDGSFLDMCLLLLFEQQTYDERQIKNSLYRNTTGFNRSDASLLSDYSIWKLNFPERSINGESKSRVISKLEKYALQLSSYREVVEVLDGLKDPRSTVARVKNEIEVDKVDPSTSLENYLNYKKVKREREQKKHAKKKREEVWREKLKLTHDIIEGAMVEIEPKAIKIKTSFEGSEMDLWFPKFSVMKGYKEELNIFQEFRIQKKMLSYKIEDALREKINHENS